MVKKFYGLGLRQTGQNLARKLVVVIHCLIELLQVSLLLQMTLWKKRFANFSKRILHLVLKGHKSKLLNELELVPNSYVSCEKSLHYNTHGKKNNSYNFYC